MEGQHLSIIKFSILVFLGCIGITGNVFVIVSAVRCPTRKNLHYLVINMAVADSLYAFLSVAIFSSGDDIPIISFFSFGVETLFTLLIISIERYRATRKTMQIARPFSMLRRFCIIGGTWMLTSFALVICLLSQKLFARQYLTSMYYLALALIIFLYLAMVGFSIAALRSLSKPQAIENSLSEEQRQQRKKRTKNAIKMVLYSLLLYSCCYLPFISFSTCEALSLYQLNKPLSYFLYYILPLVNSCLSPFIYYWCLTDFRQAVKKTLCCACFSATLPQPERRVAVLPR